MFFMIKKKFFCRMNIYIRIFQNDLYFICNTNIFCVKIYFWNKIYIFYIFIYIFLCKKSFFSVKNIFIIKLFFHIKTFFSANNVYFVIKYKYFFKTIFFFNLVLQQMTKYLKQDLIRIFQQQSFICKVFAIPTDLIVIAMVVVLCSSYIRKDIPLHD